MVSLSKQSISHRTCFTLLTPTMKIKLHEDREGRQNWSMEKPSLSSFYKLHIDREIGIDKQK